mgnify:CR=1 FL=1
MSPSDTTKTQPKWATLSFLVQTETYHAIEDACTVIAPDGIQVDDSSTLTGRDLPDGSVRMILYVPKDSVDEAHQSLQLIGRQHAVSLEVQIKDLEEQDWNAAWKAHYHPVRIGRSLRIEPIFERLPAEQGVVSVVIDPGMAFGTGTHETTQLAAEILEGWIDAQASTGRLLSEIEVLDVGTGSGILSIAALKMGIGHATATEVDEAGLENTRVNAEINGISERFEVVCTGSPSRVDGGPFELVMANIISGILLQIREELIAQVTNGGTLILSGVLQKEEAQFIEEFDSDRLKLLRRHRRGQWTASVWQKVY